MALVPNNVAIVMPEVGFEVTPTSPTILDDTVTKKKANITIRSEPIDFINTPEIGPKT